VFALFARRPRAYTAQDLALRPNDGFIIIDDFTSAALPIVEPADLRERIVSAGYRSLFVVLQEREFQRLGGTRLLNANVRIIAATNRDLRKAVERGDFREDLSYRLQVFDIRLAPLRERKSDIVLLSDASSRRSRSRSDVRLPV
jgi:Sigma-54 interaction domain